MTETTKKIRLFEAFAGVGTQSMALKRLGVDYEVVGIAEIDINAIISYAAIRNVDLNQEVTLTYDEMYQLLEAKNIGYDFKAKKVKLPRNLKDMTRLYLADKGVKNFGDVSLINPQELPDFDLFTYSFPCQDLSVSGKGKGIKKGTRSGQLLECEKIIAIKKPKYALLENVKNLVGKKHKESFDKWLEWLESQGYSNPWKVLNAKDYGVPQNRERVFVVSILEEEPYEFPESFPLRVKLKDILEDEVDEKYFLINSHIVSHEDGKLRVKEATKLGYKVAEEGDSINLEHPNSKTRRGRVGKQVAQTLTTSPQQATIVAMRGRYNSEGKVEQQLEPRKDNLTNTITTATKDNLVAEPPEYRIRRLTPLECWRLMGVTDEDFYKAKAAGISDSQLYKQAGNAIVVDVLETIFREMFKNL
ncbi:DNA (cytosine-5-)-methyltransferase [Bacillus cereus]|uniref:Cytosine-specific methyltransferase n=1 Tax=Bacillus cereus TaxID=1396 RepID=A0A9X8NUW9_BACCE|nr:DNA (cytosine-5-)-methyltransferase [Bacillus cereus]RWQ72972.1 DNA (cytosine-5-)-methyltransferase [Bacillus cereus]